MLADRLKDATRSVHAKAERSGIVSRILRGRASPFAYAVYLRNLHAVYSALERALDKQRRDPAIACVRETRLYRRGPAGADLVRFAGSSWRDSLPVLASARRYIDRIDDAERCSSALVAHAYTRYLGDINGGRIIRRRLQEKAGISDEALRFYSYPKITDVPAFAKEYRTRVDLAGTNGVVDALAAEEAVAAFRLNIALSEEVDSISRECL